MHDYGTYQRSVSISAACVLSPRSTKQFSVRRVTRRALPASAPLRGVRFWRVGSVRQNANHARALPRFGQLNVNNIGYQSAFERAESDKRLNLSARLSAR
jgi:hypothetical protein